MGRAAATIVCVLSFGVLAGCVPAGVGTSNPGEKLRLREAGAPDLLLRREFAEFSHFTALDVIMRFRPRWLRGRPGLMGDEGSMYDYPVVWVDHNRYESFDVLRILRAGELQSIRFLTPSEATQRYGIGHFAGAIVITTRS